jgi:hypothetical protein
MVDYELLRINYFQNDLPCPFELKSGGKINIYPILVKDYSLYEFYKTIMEFDKNSINDIEIIQMSYLDFLVNIVFQQDKDSGGKLCGYLSLILKEDKVSIVENKGKYCIVILDENDSIKYIIKSKELEEIYKISSYQNDINYDDTKYSKDIQDAINDYYSLKYKNSHTPNLEEMKAFVIGKTGILMREINEMTYRNFFMVYESTLGSEIYISQKIIQASEKYKVDDFQHPLFTEKKNKVDEVFSTDAEQFKNKINNING